MKSVSLPERLCNQIRNICNEIHFLCNEMHGRLLKHDFLVKEALNREKNKE